MVAVQDRHARRPHSRALFTPDEIVYSTLNRAGNKSSVRYPTTLGICGLSQDMPAT